MWTMKKFLYYFELETGGKFSAGYCAAANIAYIFGLFSIYQHMDVKKVMTAYEEVKALGLAAFINFMIYYIVGSLLVIISINERKYKSLLYYLKVHGTMTCGIAVIGPFLAHNFGNQRSLLLVIADALFRFYSLGCFYSLYEKCKHEQHEREKVEASEKAFASYGTADAVDHHHATVEEMDEPRRK